MIFYNSLLPSLNTFVKNMKSAFITHKNKEANMTATQRNKEAIAKMYEQSLNQKHMELLKDFVSSSYTGPLGESGPAGFEQAIAPLIKAFPDIKWHVKDIVSEDNKVVVRWELQGTHTAPFRNLTATGKTVSNDGMAIYELEDGKITKAVLQTDRLGFLQALDVLPADPVASSDKKGNVYFIDKFFVPAAARNAFSERTAINRAFIKKLPGFIEDAAFEHDDEEGNLVCITVARWANKEALDDAKETVQAAYKKEGFDLAGMFRELNITANRGIYTESR